MKALTALACLCSAWGCRAAGPDFRPLVGVDGSLAREVDGGSDVGVGYALVADIVPLSERWSLALAFLDSDFEHEDERGVRVEVLRLQLRWHGLVSLNSAYGPEDEHPGYLAVGVGSVLDAHGAGGTDYEDGDYVDLEVGWRWAIDKRGWVLSAGLNLSYVDVEEDSGKPDVTTEAFRGALLFGIHWGV
ncbi:MAG: hypothetical protein GY711_09815 [bacterium]|nr:hypothetical protein [bacterium]